jgi:phosphatidylglycerophosphate synthase
MSRPSLAQLRPVCQPGTVLARRNAEHWVALLYIRRLSLRLTRLLAPTRVTPNQVTVVMMLVGLAATGLLAVDGLIGALTCAVGIQVYLLLDCTDGELARWRRSTSARGVYLDRLSHYVVEAALFTMFGLRVGGSINSAWLSVGLATALLVVISKVETDLVAATVGPDEVRDDGGAATPSNRLLRIARTAAYPLKLHRTTGAVEASLLIVAAALAVTAGWSQAEAALAIYFLLIAAIVAVGHVLSIVSSRRLEPTRTPTESS